MSERIPGVVTIGGCGFEVVYSTIEEGPARYNPRGVIEIDAGIADFVQEVAFWQVVIHGWMNMLGVEDVASVEGICDLIGNLMFQIQVGRYRWAGIGGASFPLAVRFPYTEYKVFFVNRIERECEGELGEGEEWDQVYGEIEERGMEIRIVGEGGRGFQLQTLWHEILHYWVEGHGWGMVGVPIPRGVIARGLGRDMAIFVRENLEIIGS